MRTDDIVDLLCRLGEPEYRGRQIAEWVYRKSARSFDAMTSLPKALRERLAAQLRVGCTEVVDSVTGDGGTVKLLLGLDDGERIETVLLPYQDRTSACLSTQAGCAVRCRFCASGIGGLRRNLTPGEIVDQVLALQSRTGARVDHVVFMGVGEPLMNYEATLAAVRLLTGEMGIGQRRITISTVGIPAGIRKLAKAGLQVGLAISLHAPDQGLREELVPAAKKHTLGEILEAAREYVRQTGRRITIEYVVLGGVNDGPGHANRLGQILRGLGCAINLIPYNPVDPDPGYAPPARGALAGFRGILAAKGLTVTQRYRRGSGIGAACGQLRAWGPATGRRRNRRSRGGR
jgi:23S rRNA (adenine2503-C2)-methyltransferase